MAKRKSPSYIKISSEASERFKALGMNVPVGPLPANRAARQQIKRHTGILPAPINTPKKNK